MKTEERIPYNKKCPKCGAAMEAEKINKWFAASAYCTKCDYEECIYTPPDDGGGPDGTWIA